MCKRTSLLLFCAAVFPRMERFNMKYIDEEDTVMNFTHLVGNNLLILLADDELGMTDDIVQ